MGNGQGLALLIVYSWIELRYCVNGCKLVEAQVGNSWYVLICHVHTFFLPLQNMSFHLKNKQVSSCYDCEKTSNLWTDCSAMITRLNNTRLGWLRQGWWSLGRGLYKMTFQLCFCKDSMAIRVWKVFRELGTSVNCLIYLSEVRRPMMLFQHHTY